MAEQARHPTKRQPTAPADPPDAASLEVAKLLQTRTEGRAPMGLWGSVRCWPIAFWHWIGGRWKWETMLGAGLGMVRLGEYGITLGLLSLSGLAAVSKIAHWERTSIGSPDLTKLAKRTGYAVAVCSFGVLLIVIISIKGDDHWSHLPVAWDRLTRWARGTEVLNSPYVLLSTSHIGKVEVGDSGAFLDDPGFKEGLARLLGDTHLLVEQIDGRLKVSTEVKDADGRTLATLVRNEWKPGTPPLGDRNYTNDALEVLDTSGEVVLQVVMLADRIRLQGKWYHSSGKRTTIMKSKKRPGYVGIHFAATPADENDPFQPYGVEKIDRMFLYPSAKYLGKFAPIVILGGQ